MIFGFFVDQKEEYKEKMPAGDALQKLIFPESQEKTLSQGLEEGGIVSLYEIDGEMAGFCYGRVENHRFTIVQMGLLEEHRMVGNGDFMMRHMMNRALDLGYRSMDAWATEDSFDFFEAVHFAQCDEEFQYDGEKRIHMRVNPAELRCAEKKQKFNPYYGTCKMPKKYM